MEWFEYLILAGALIIVIIPIYQSFRNFKKGKIGCSGDCGLCINKKACENIQKTLKEQLKKEKNSKS